MKIVYMGTPLFAVPALDELVAAGHDILLVVSQQDKPKGRGNKLQATPVKEKALKLGLEVHQPERVNDHETIKKLKELSPDFIVVTAYGQILKEEILSIPKYDCLNIHASLLPKYRGAAPINWSIINGEVKTGITIMKMEKGLDSGPIILMEEIPIDRKDTSETLHDKLAVIGGRLIIQAINDIVSEKAVYTPQDNDQSSYSPMLYKDTGRIDWKKKSEEIYNLIRGLLPWPHAYMVYEGLRVKIMRAEQSKEIHDILPGTIVEAVPSGIKIAASEGYIIVKELQFPNKKSMEVSAFLLGNKIEEGYIL